MKKKFILGAFVCLLFLGVTGQTLEKWYISNMSNMPIGYLKESSITDNGKITSGTFMKLIFNRKNSKIEMLLQSEVTESVQGEFMTARGAVKTTGQDISLEGFLKKDTMYITMSTGGKKYDSKLAVKEKLEGPLMVRKLSQSKLKAPGDSISFATFSPDLGMVVHVTRKYLANEQVTINGNTRTSIKLKESFKENPVSKELFVDENFNLLKTVDPSPFGNIESILSSKDVAETAMNSVVLPTESYERTVLASNVRFTDPRNLEQVTYKITLTNKSYVFPDLNTTHQKILERGNDYAILQYTRPRMPKSNVETNRTLLADFLTPNSLINSDDPEIVKIALDLTRNIKDDFEKAIAIKNWVSANVKVDLGVALAPGSEVNKIRKGTCVAFSTYYGSLLRAANIPARYIGGYVYMNGIWGGHTWIEIYYKGTWLPVDATINTTDIADAARICFGDGWSLKNGATEFAASKGGILYGNADIKVLSYVINGKKTTVTDMDKPYKLENNTYINPGKKMRIQKAADYEFAMLDELWPSKTFATVNFKEGTVKLMDGYWMAPRSREEAITKELESISKSKINATQNIKGNTLYSMEDTDKAFFVKTKGKDLLIFYASGNNPIKMLSTLLDNTKFD